MRFYPRLSYFHLEETGTHSSFVVNAKWLSFRVDVPHLPSFSASLAGRETRFRSITLSQKVPLLASTRLSFTASFPVIHCVFLAPLTSRKVAFWELPWDSWARRESQGYCSSTLPLFPRSDRWKKERLGRLVLFAKYPLKLRVFVPTPSRFSLLLALGKGMVGVC